MSILIPKQLRNFGFVKIKDRSKAPFEFEWQNNPLNINEIQKWLEQNSNYGVLGGVNGLVIIDCDTEELAFATKSKLPNTFRVITGSGKLHAYYLCPDIQKKIVLKKDDIHHGEIISCGSQVVGPGSIHPNGNKYTLSDDVEIASISLDEIAEVLNEYLPSAAHSTQSLSIPEAILEGSRNDTLFRLGCSLRSKNLSEGAISAALLQENQMKCVPPLPEDECQLIIASVLKKPSGLSSEFMTVTLTISTLTSAVAATADYALGEIRRSDVGNADHFVKFNGENVRYVMGTKQWFIWSGKHWEPDEQGKIFQLARNTIRRMEKLAVEMEYSNQRADWLKHCLASESAQNLRDMLEVAKTMPPIAATFDQFDTDNFALNVSNGTLDLNTGTLRDHRREDYITKIINISYDKDAKAPRFEQFVNEIFAGDKKLIHYVHKVIGYSLTGSIKERVLFFLYGSGKNGKTKLMNLVMEMLGPYATKAAANLLIEKRSDQHPTEIADLRGARVIVHNEAAENRKLAEALVKDLTGGDKGLKARRMHENFFSFNPVFKIFLYGNHKPVIKGRDQAIWDRIKLIPFNVRFDGDLEDKDLEEKLVNELPGFLAWCLRGLLLWQAEGLSPEPTAVSASIDDYRKEMDEIGEFVDEWICDVSESTPYGFATCKDVYAKYLAWAESEGQGHLKRKQFNSALEEIGFKKRPLSGNVLHWIGKGLKEVA